MKSRQIEIRYTPAFLKSLRKFPKSQIKFLSEKEKIFRENPFDARLKTHKLRGELEGFYAFSVSYHWRVVFHSETENIIVFDAIGTHEVYR